GAQNQLFGTHPGGVPNFVCEGYADADGRAYGGECRIGLVRCAWNYNVIWKGVPSGVEGRASGTNFEPMAAVEYDIVLTPLGNDHYRLVVPEPGATGPIGWFTGRPPPR